VTKLHQHLVVHGSAASVWAVEALGRFSSPDSVKPLLAAFRHPRLQESVVSALGMMSALEAQKALLSMASQSDCPVRVQALEALGFAPQVDPLPLLRKAMEGELPERRAVCRALSRLGIVRGWHLLTRALQDPCAEVVIEAVKAMADIGDESFATALRTMVENPFPKVRATVAAALGQVVSLDLQDAILTLSQDKDPRVRANAVQSASCYHGNHFDARNFYEPILKDPHHRVRATAVVNLWPFDQATTGVTLQSLLSSKTPVERSAGYWCVGRVEEERAVDWLMDALLSETDPSAIEQALLSLGALHRSDAFEPVRRMISAPWPRVRIRASMVLATVGRVNAVKPLVDALRLEMDPNVRSAILRAVARLSPQEGVAHLPGPGEQDSDRVVANLVEGVGESGQVSAIPFLKPMLAHKAARVRGTAIVSLVGLGDLLSLDSLESLYESAPVTACWVLRSVGMLLTTHGLFHHPHLASTLGTEPRRSGR